MPSNILRTAIGTMAISDSVLSLMANQYLPGDVHAAVQHFPNFKFDPVRDSEFYRQRWWLQPYEVQSAAAQKILDRFNSWYGSATVMERVFLGVAGLTDSSEQMDNLVFDAYAKMKETYRIDMWDSDGTHFHADDYHAMRLEDNLNSAISTDHCAWWSRRFEEQVRRVSAMPCVTWERFVEWNNRRDEHEYVLSHRFRSYRVPNVGLTPKKIRRVFNRSLRLFSRMYGDNTTRKFLNGKNLWLHGKHFVWKLKLEPAEIIHATVSPSDVHTPFRITICDNQMNELCSACILFGSTPVLDQAVAFGLMVSHAEDELGFLRKANLYSFTPEGRTHELLLSMPGARDFRPVERMADRMTYLRQQEMDDACEDPWRIPEDTTIDDGPADDDACDNDWTDYAHDAYMKQTQDPPPDSDYASAYSSEYDEPIRSLVRHAALTEDQENGIERMHDLWRIESRNERYWRAQHPIMSRLREKLLGRLDVDPGILRYMCFPEFRFYFLPKVLTAPRLEGWVGARVPLFENGADE